ncbi:MAG TPA: protein kinase [Geothrix sp.]|nr:protein kinase [Geothrix sp.]
MAQEAPKVIGRYNVLQPLGVGGMGAVYLCQDPLLKRKVAVKIVLNAHSDSEAMLTRFQRESEISAQLNHPNIISIFDVGNDELVGPFLTMEFVDGSSLAKLLQTESPVEPRVALDWICQIGQALVAAESAGIVHRDIKPENVLISKAGRIKLTDFGLARNEESNLTTTGVVMGTPSYTAPELLAGKPASPVTDRWAYAVTVFQLVTGNKLPHQGDTLPALLHSIANSMPTLPEGMSAPLQRFFLKALHKDPARRFDSTLHFLEALADALGMRELLDPRGLTLLPPKPEPAADDMATRTLPVGGAGKQVTPGAGEAPASPTPAAVSKERRADTPTPHGSKLTAPPAELFRRDEKDKENEKEKEASFNQRIETTSPLPFSKASLPMAKPSGRSPRYAAKPLSEPINSAWVTLALLVLLVLGYFGLPRSVHFESHPSGVKITVDNKDLGTTPLDHRFFYGTHVASAKLDGYEEKIQTFDARDGQLTLELEPRLDWIEIKTEPEGADVYLGSRHLGRTPLTGVMVPLQPERVIITLDGYRQEERKLGPTDRLPAVIKLSRLN